MIWAAVSIAKVSSWNVPDHKQISDSCFVTRQDGDFTINTGKVVGLFAGLMMFHGLLVSGNLIVALKMLTVTFRTVCLPNTSPS